MGKAVVKAIVPVVDMPTKCANPGCGRGRHLLSEGQVFQFEIVSISVAAADDPEVADTNEVPQREKVHFWLCDACSGNAIVTLDPIQGLQLLPLEELNRQAESAENRHHPRTPAAISPKPEAPSEMYGE